jgi:hypothetical protein
MMAGDISDQLHKLSLEVAEKEDTWKTGLVYDELMTKHVNQWSRFHPEAPERITRMWAMLGERGYVKRCKRIPVCGAMW